MLIKFFRNGKGAGAGPVGYLVADKVLAYDDNRDLIRDADGQPKTVTREPLPEVLRGNPDRTEALIDASRHQWTYRAGVISFAATDTPTEEQQAEVMEHFERLAFAGLDPTQYDVLWVRHTHEDRVELHFCTPRLELGLTRIDREDGTWLVLDPTKTRLRTCTLGGRSVTCIKIEED